MCGILGYYKKGGLSRADLLAGMEALDSLRHRGPDGAGMVLVSVESGQVWSLRLADTPLDVPCDLLPAEYQDGQADLLLGHRRLSIFDLSSRGHQPMQDASGNLISFNGEVYNFYELRTELEKQGHTFQTATDTEVILAAYRQWGPDGLKRFNGMWSILLYDPAARKLLVTVDRIGVKQLYAYSEGDALILASEIKAIRKIAGKHLSIHAENVNSFLLHGHIDLGESTLFAQVRRFKPAHYLLSHPAEFNETAPKSFWELPTGVKEYESIQQAADVLRSLLEDAIRLRMRSDVPWGTTLSGGLDSSSIIYAAQAIRQREGITTPINTFTAVFPGEEGDESAFVKRIEAELETSAMYTNPLEEFDFADFERFLHHQDLPVINTSMYAQWSVMKMVGHSSVKVLLDGQGGDELFAGYHHHIYKHGRDLLLHGRFGAYKRMVKEVSALKGLDPAHVKRIVLDDLKLYLRLKTGYRMPGPEEVTTWNKALSLRDVLAQDIRSWVMPMLLRYEDRNSMAFAVEARLPFLDYRIVEFAIQLPDDFKIHEGWQKYILRLAMPELPDVIRWRKDKKGFTTPHNAWMARYRDKFLEYAQTVPERGIPLPFGGKDIHSLNETQLFRVASLGQWLRD